MSNEFSCSCRKKKFPNDFEKKNVQIQHHDMCCGENIYRCAYCERYVGSECTRVDLDDEGLYDGMSANDYVNQFVKFHS
jgi:hypothetical protein